MSPGKRELFDHGRELLAEFCEANGLHAPPVIESDTPGRLGTCAYYRPHEITITVAKCAAIGVSGMAWSYPGYVIDRTPYGVIQHEQGHAVDVLLGDRAGPYYSEFSTVIRCMAGEERITNYCPNDAEWFAEMFRLFVTNSDLLRRLRPRTHSALFLLFKPVVDRPWRDVLKEAPDRVIEQAAKKVAAVR